MNSHHRTSLESWIEWKRQCALDLCCDVTQDDLAAYGIPIIIGAFRTFDPDLPIPSGLDGADARRDCWHLFETHMHATSGATGKRWKDWLFEKAAGSRDEPVDVLEKAAYRCMRTAVKRFCIAEGRTKDRLDGRVVVSKDEPSGSDPESPAWEESMSASACVDPSSQAAIQELWQIAQKQAESYFEGMERRARIALFADSCDLALDEPEVERAAGRKSSTLYADINRPRREGEKQRVRCSRLLDELRTQVERAYPGEDDGALNSLTRMALAALRDRCTEWIKLEESCAALFILAEQRMTP